MELINFITTNTQNIYDRIKKLYELEKEINLDEETDIPLLTVVTCPDNHYNRATYLWSIEVTKQLLVVLNILIGFYNDSGFVNDDDYTDTPPIQKWYVPDSLIIDDVFFKSLQANYDAANKVLDELQHYAEIQR